VLPAGSQAETRPGFSTPMNNPATILIVDDDAALRMLF
jgi:hypothetical protein